MSGFQLLINLLGAVALLIWATRMVRTGVERLAGDRLRGLIAAGTRSRLTACGAGIGAAAALQSSTATALLVVGFADRGLVALAPALALMLGADIGSTLVVQVLAYDLKALVPVLFIVGVVCFMTSSSARVRQSGRIVVGLALMILALGLVVAASEPLRQSHTLAIVLNRLAGEPILALIVGAGLGWMIHSSVATVLLIASLATGGVVEAPLAAALVLGANVGAGLVPLGLAMRSGASARRVLLGNLAFRLAGALLLLPVAGLAIGYFGQIDGSPARQVANFHTCFNLLLAALFLPLTTVAARLLERLVRDPRPAPGEARIGHLDDDAFAKPAVALSAATREVLRLAETVEVMLREAILPFQDRDAARSDDIRRLDSTVDTQQEAIKLYLTRLTRHPLSEEDGRRAFDLILFTTNLEHVGDIIDKSLLPLASKKRRLGVSFSDEGWRELEAMHGFAVEQMRLAVTVFVTRDVAMARDLVRAKERVRSLEREATESHLARLRAGTVASIETSSLHIDMLRDLKQIVAHLTAVAHPILEANGELSGTRLVPREEPGQGAAVGTPGPRPA